MSSVTLTIQLNGDLDQIVDVIHATKAHFAAQGVSASLRITGHIDLDERVIIEPAGVESPLQSMSVAGLLVGGVTTSERNISTRVAKCLARAQINTVGELILKDNDDLMSITNFGEGALQLVRSRLNDLGLSLKPTRP